jgi:hypothetical protein
VKLSRYTRAGRRRANVDAILSAYVEWRRECTEVRAAYDRWTFASIGDTYFAFAAFHVALDHEERAASRYARLLSNTRIVPELEMARQLAQLPASCEAMAGWAWWQ